MRALRVDDAVLMDVACDGRFGLNTPAIYICGQAHVDDVLNAHPEIGFLGSVMGGMAAERERAIGGSLPPEAQWLTCPILDTDERAKGFGEGVIPSKAALAPLLDFLKAWRAGQGLPGARSLLLHCAQGAYRSTAAALAAHVLVTGDPWASAEALWAGGVRDANWAVARLLGEMMGQGDALYRAAQAIAWSRDNEGGFDPEAQRDR